MKSKIPSISAGVITLLLVASATYLYLRDKAAEVKKTELLCKKGYSMTLRYYAPDKNGLLSKLSLTVSKDSTANTYEMNSTMSASGAKFETTKTNYFLWEHQGTFLFGKDDQNITECKERQ